MTDRPSRINRGKPVVDRTIAAKVKASALLPVFLSIFAASTLSGTAALATSSVSEFVVPGGAIITLQDGQRIAGHIVDLDQTNVVILTEDGTEQVLPRATVDGLRFETVSGEDVSGTLLGWKPGIYELTAEEAVVKVYSIVPRALARTDSNGDDLKTLAGGQGGAEPAVSPDPEPVVRTAIAVNTDAGIEPAPATATPHDQDAVTSANSADKETAVNGTRVDAEATSESGEQVALSTPTSDLEINVSVGKAREGGDAVIFDVELSRPSTSSVVLIYATIDGTAIGGEDYQAARGVLVIKAGETSASIEAPVIDDDVSEGDENLQLFLTVDPTVASVNNRQIVATIEDNDQG